MSHWWILLIIMAGQAVGFLISRKSDKVSHFLWLAAGAAPGCSLLVGQPWYMLIILPIIMGAIIWRRMKTKSTSQQAPPA